MDETVKQVIIVAGNLEFIKQQFRIRRYLFDVINFTVLCFKRI